MICSRTVALPLLVCCALTWGLTASPVSFAEEAKSPMSGTWLHSSDAAEEKARKKAIDKAADSAPRMARGKVRKKLTQRTNPPAEFTIELTGEAFNITRAGNSMKLEFGAAPKSVGKGDKSGKVSARKAGDVVTVTSKGSNGTLTSTYRLSADGNKLIRSTKMVSDKLDTPIAFDTSYRRK